MILCHKKQTYKLQFHISTIHVQQYNEIVSSLSLQIQIRSNSYLNAFQATPEWTVRKLLWSFLICQFTQSAFQSADTHSCETVLAESLGQYQASSQGLHVVVLYLVYVSLYWFCHLSYQTIILLHSDPPAVRNPYSWHTVIALSLSLSLSLLCDAGLCLSASLQKHTQTQKYHSYTKEADLQFPLFTFSYFLFFIFLLRYFLNQFSWEWLH